mmetsp:Transcript_84627/g.192900  ORF Transcript_84627/g.192900 Transcript_84627/m.192900 type:complete len:642 (-) Transcript_84627:279-2204(-)
MKQSPAYKSRVPIVLEVTIIAAITGASSYYVPACQPIMGSVIHACFESCEGREGLEPASVELMDTLGLCDDHGIGISWVFMAHFMFAAVVKLLQTSLTFGTGVPAGLFVPSLFMGALLGRMTGNVMVYLNAQVWTISDRIEPGVYAMVGAAAMLGGVCRVTISLTVIMFELTGGLQYVVPFMVGILTAKVVGDAMNDGIYDSYIQIRKYPFLHQHDAADPMFQQSADSIMENQVFGVSLYGNTIGSLLNKFRQYNFHGFPLLASSEHDVLLGYLHTDEMKSHFEKVVSSWGAAYTLDSPVRFKRFEQLNPFSRGVLERKTVKGRTTCFRSVGLAVWFSVRFNRMIHGAYKNADVDLSEFVDETIMRMVPETPLEQVHTMFQQLGIKAIFFVRHGFLKGMLTKKNYLKHMAEHHSKQHTSNTGSSPVAVDTATTSAAGPDPEKARASLARRPSTIRRINVDMPGLTAPLLGGSSPPSLVPDERDEESSEESSDGDKAGTLVQEIALRNVETSAMASEAAAGTIVRRRTREFLEATSVEKLSREMVAAAERQDYITAGEIQGRLRRLAQQSPSLSVAEPGAKPSFKRHATMPVGGGSTGVRRRQVLVKEHQTLDGMSVTMPTNLAGADLQGIAAKLPGNRGLL